MQAAFEGTPYELTDDCHRIRQGKHSVADNLCDHQEADKLPIQRVPVSSWCLVLTYEGTAHLPTHGLVLDVMLVFVTKHIIIPWNDLLLNDGSRFGKLLLHEAVHSQTMGVSERGGGERSS